MYNKSVDGSDEQDAPKTPHPLFVPKDSVQDTEPSKETREAQYVGLLRSYEELKKERDNLYNQLLRSTADLRNVFADEARRSAQSERSFRSRLLLRFINPINTFRLMITELTENKTMLEGMQMTYTQLINTILEAGGTILDPAQGTVMNYDEHMVVSSINDETTQPNTIAKTLEIGLKVDGMVVKPAQVVVYTAASN